MADTAAGWVVEKVLEKAVDEAVDAGATFVAGGGVAYAAKKAMDVLKFADGQIEKAICREAQEKLRCTHIVVCPHGTFNTRKTDMIDYVKKTGGMAFVYKSIALGHFQADFKCAQLSSNPIRCVVVDGKRTYTDSPIERAWDCMHCAADRASRG
jgi:hypothetical protein